MCKERIRCIDDNQEALIWRLRLIEAAKEELILATFDTQEDHSGRDILAALFRAAQRGVRIKLLIDGFNGQLHIRKNPSFYALNTLEQVEIRLYNTITLKSLHRISYRMHDKYLIADASLYLLGGRNTNDLFLGNYRSDYNVDRDILVYEGESERGSGTEEHLGESSSTSLSQVKDYFQRIWEISQPIRFHAKAHSGESIAGRQELLMKHYQELHQRYSGVFTPVDWQAETWAVKGIQLITNPMEAASKEPVLWNQLLKHMSRGKNILIHTPYMMCDELMYQKLRDLSEDGRVVQMITNSVETGANPWGCMDYMNEKKRILGTGMEVFEYTGAQSLHAKAVLVDDELTLVGSFNFDMRSVYLDTEMMLVIEDCRLNGRLRENMERSMTYSRRIHGDGSLTLGDNYQIPEMSRKKRMIYGGLHWLIRPFRGLL